MSGPTDTETIAGLSTRKYRVLSDGTLYEELWIASDPALLRELIVARAPETFGRMSGCLGTAGGAQRVEATEAYRRLYSEGGRSRPCSTEAVAPRPGRR